MSRFVKKLASNHARLFTYYFVSECLHYIISIRHEDQRTNLFFCNVENIYAEAS